MTTEFGIAERNASRFAPSTTGRAHPGTLLAGLLCWLDARVRGAEIVLRLEDLDRGRTKPGFVDRLKDDLEWFGLDWDRTMVQSESRPLHEAAIDRLAAEGDVYACECTRSEIRRAGPVAPDGSHRYPGTCRGNVLSKQQWRDDPRPLRLRFACEELTVDEEGGPAHVGDPALLFGDPLLRRRDGSYAYHLASVVDDEAAGVGRIVRGRDLAPSTLIQVALQRRLGLPTPRYRHHLLFLERRERKLSKLHGAVGCERLRARYSSRELVGLLGSFVGIVPEGTECTPAELVRAFDWTRVSSEDCVLRWDEADGLSLEAHDPADSLPG